MRILLFGATGPTGIALVRELLQTHKDYTIILYVRSPQKVPDDIKTNSSVTVIHGQLDDVDALSKAIKGVDIVLSTLGPSVKQGPFHRSDTPLAHAYARIIDLMHDHHVQRLICLGTASITDPIDKSSLVFSGLVNGVAMLARPAYKDVVAIGETVRTVGSDLDWTIVRVPILTEKETKEIYAGYIGDSQLGTFLSRAGFAAFVVDEIEKRAWVHKAPMICSV
jgi:putative NADH-flavin reductase